MLNEHSQKLEQIAEKNNVGKAILKEEFSSLQSEFYQKDLDKGVKIDKDKACLNYGNKALDYIKNNIDKYKN